MRMLLIIVSMLASMIAGLNLSCYGTETKPMHQKRNVIPGLRKVDWSDTARQNEFLNCVISAMGHLGKKVSYDDLACISGCSFRACGSHQGLNPGAYHIIEDMPIIEHTFKMLGYKVKLYKPSDYETDRKLIMDSIDRGIPVLTFQGVVRYAECCIISGYDDNGDTLLGWNPFMYLRDDNTDPDDKSTGYFRKTKWHDGDLKQGAARILIIGEPTEPPSDQERTREVLRYAVRLIRGGYAGHTHYAELVCKDPGDWFMLDLTMVCLGCNMYQDKVYVAPFLREAKTILKDKADVLEQSAKLYDQISTIRREMNKYLPEDQPQTGDRVKDKGLREHYAQCIYRIRDLEKKAADLLVKI